MRKKRTKQREIFDAAYAALNGRVVDDDGVAADGLHHLIIDLIDNYPHRVTHDGIDAVMSALFAVYHDFDAEDSSDHSLGGSFLHAIYRAGWMHAIARFRDA